MQFHAGHKRSGCDPTLLAPLQVATSPAPGQEAARGRHMHCPLEIGVVLSGAFNYLHSRGASRLLPGQLWWAGCWEPHPALPPRSRSFAVTFHIRPDALMSDPFHEIDWLAPFVAPPARRPQFHALPDRRRAAAIAGEIARIARRKAPHWRTTAWIELHRLMTLAWDGWKNAPSRSAAGRIATARVAPAVRLVSERLPRGVRLDHAARACSMSRFRFATAFASAMGISFAKFALRTRLAAASHDLIEGDRPLTEMAARWDFTDASHFHRVFTQHYGCTPGAFRARAC